MIITEPKVELISRPQIISSGVYDFLKPYGQEATDWWAERYADVIIGAKNDAETLIEVAGRGCYMSFAPGINPNVTKVRERQDEYLQNIISSGHGSVSEFGFYVFGLNDVSRVFTAELNRHRAGTAIAERSMRYVRLTDYDLVMPEEMNPYMDEINEITRQTQYLLAKIAHKEKLDTPGNFSRKKIVTSAMRRIVPMGVATSTVWGANIRTLRHVIELRTSVHAEYEIRQVFQQIGHYMQEECPALFSDFTENADGEWVSASRKV